MNNYKMITTLKSKLSIKTAIVLIDDDPMMRLAWKFAAENIEQKFSSYSSTNDFNLKISEYDISTIIYIDSELGNGIKGEIYAKELYDKGFKELHLTTGHDPDQFTNIPWIKSIIGKQPPFTLQGEAHE